MVFDAFKKLSNKSNLFLGSPEAEAESTKNSRVPLLEVYEDFHNLIDGLSGEKFIIVGRKGAGKSAFGEYIVQRSSDEPNLHCKFIRKSNLNLEQIVQIGTSEGIAIDNESFFRWTIYTNILRMVVNLEVFKESKDINKLKLFLDKNAGFIDINELEIKELVAKHGFDVAVDQLKHFLSAKFNKNLEIKSARVPYYKLLMHLEELIIKLFKSELNLINQNSFVLFFDDLDIAFDVHKESTIANLVGLLRASRYVNNEVFGKNGINAKAIILIRDDIENFLSTRESDTAKMFASYSSKINWYQDEYVGNPNFENNLNLKKFINNRIIYSFKKQGLKVDENNAWSSLVADDGQHEKSSFKYIVNQTLFRPRDLLLFFLPLDRGNFKYPLDQNSIYTLVSNYSEELAKELKSELSSFYSSNEIENIFSALGLISKQYIPYNEAVQIIKETCINIEPNSLLESLFERSIIGTVDDRNWYQFRCRSSTLNSQHIDQNLKIVVQYGIRTYLSSRGYR